MCRRGVAGATRRDRGSACDNRSTMSTVADHQSIAESLPVGQVAAALVDLEAIRSNTATVRRRAGDAEVIAVVKADGYGHGALPAARAALAGGAGRLGVAFLAEALDLRAGGDRGPAAGLAHGPRGRVRRGGRGGRRDRAGLAVGPGRRRGGGPRAGQPGQDPPRGRHRPRPRRRHGRRLARPAAAGGPLGGRGCGAAGGHHVAPGLLRRAGPPEQRRTGRRLR